MTDISSFLKLSPKEAVLESWEVVDDRGTPTVGEIVVSLIVLAGVYYALHFAVGFLFTHLGVWRWLYRDMADVPLLRQVVRLLEWVLELGLPAGVLGWSILTRPRIQGHVCLTNWRLLYFARGHNWFRSLYFLSAANLEDVLGIHSFYDEGLFGKKNLHIQVHTRFRDGLSISAGESGSILTRVPLLGKLLGKLLIRNTLGKDAAVMLPVLFTRVRQHHRAAVDSSLTY